MATHKIYLPPPVDRRHSPYYLWYKKTCPAADNYEFHAGWNLEVPSHWKIHALRVALNATADVADRYIYLVKRKVYAKVNIQIEELVSSAITANENKSLALQQMSGFVNCTPDNDQYAVLNKESWIINGDDYLYLYFQGDVAGDITYIYVEFKYMNWEMGMDPPAAAQEKQNMIQRTPVDWIYGNRWVKDW